MPVNFKQISSQTKLLQDKWGIILLADMRFSPSIIVIELIDVVTQEVFYPLPNPLLEMIVSEEFVIHKHDLFLPPMSASS